ncbi:MAG: alpha-L-fucosidase [Acutalibacteraceae bacterium]|nr:alpha-L-fucosidase [Acutalibacteraceae bacterium]
MATKGYIKKANSVVPSKAQLDFMDTEFIAFIHYGMNTFTNNEWGTGREPVKYFKPAEFSAKQWVMAIKSAGMKGLVLTCKFSDGFCLWPSKFTDHTVKNSPWLDGEGDMVRELSEECRKEGVKFGIYLSPYDMHEPSFGTEAYNDFFVNQLTELCTEYGDIFCVWFERDESGKQPYDWERYYKTIRELQPDAMICNCGPDIRWCGNHSGIGRQSEWSVVPKELINDAPAALLVQPDLGSRKKIKKAKELVWFPAIMDMKMRPGWFFHDHETPNLKVLSTAIMSYFKSVGNNGTFILNVSPSHNGRIDKKDLEQLVTLGAQLELEFKEDFTKEATFTSSGCSDELHSEKFINSGKSYFKSAQGAKKSVITVDMGDVKSIDKIILAENIATGQQIEKFSLYYFYNKRWHKIYKGTTIGRKKICIVTPMEARRIKLVIEKTRDFATISEFKVY